MNISSIGSSGVSAYQDAGGGDGDVMQQLRQLAQNDPAKLKKVAGDMAKALRADAQKATGAAGQALSKLADRLDKVARSGDLSALAPQQGAQGPEGAQGAHGAHGHKHHGHHHGGGKSSSGTGDAQSANANDPFAQVRSDILQAFTAALDAANAQAQTAPTTDAASAQTQTGT